jgi:CelD/BcsL family acetyltransferase involved in cellulose biosynthesis
MTMLQSTIASRTQPDRIASLSSPHSTHSGLLFRTITTSEIDAPIEQAWERLRAEDRVYDSPYFDAEFTKAVARVRDDVRIAIAFENNVPVSILPLQENSSGNAVPAGGRLNDWHGPIGRSDADIIEQMMANAGMSSYSFHAAATRDRSVSKYHFKDLESHFLDLSQGWDAYRSWVRKHSSTVKRQGQKTRALGREVGPIRFEFDCDQEEILERLIAMKRTRYQRSNTFDILSVDWAAELLREIFKIRKSNFRGLLSAYWAGDQLVGVHFGMLTQNILHYWFPVYDPQYQRYSPGTEMLLQAAEHACDVGVKKLDLGYGDDDYKFKFCNAHEPVAVGMVNFNSIGWELAKQKYDLRIRLKRIPLKPLAKRMLRSVFPNFGGWNFR